MKYLLCLFFVAVVSTLITGCATERQIQVVDRIQRDTIYINKVQYDSIYIDRWQKVYQQSDTVYLESTKYEYRYKLLRDTVYRTRIDSIPVIKTIVETKVERYVPAIYRLSLSIVIILTLSLIIYIVWKSSSTKAPGFT